MSVKLHIRENFVLDYLDGLHTHLLSMRHWRSGRLMSARFPRAVTDIYNRSVEVTVAQVYSKRGSEGFKETCRPEDSLFRFCVFRRS